MAKAPVVVPRSPDPGLDLAYENALDKLRGQQEALRQLDTKAAVLIAAVAVAIGGFAVAPLSLLERVVGAIALGGTAVAAAWTFRLRQVADAPDPLSLASYASYDPLVIKQQFLPAMLAAWEFNLTLYDLKARNFQITVVLAAVTGVLVLLDRLILG